MSNKSVENMPSCHAEYDENEQWSTAWVARYSRQRCVNFGFDLGLHETETRCYYTPQLYPACRIDRIGRVSRIFRICRIHRICRVFRDDRAHCL